MEYFLARDGKPWRQQQPPAPAGGGGVKRAREETGAEEERPRKAPRLDCLHCGAVILTPVDEDFCSLECALCQ
jgi:hypothetical protein